MDPWDKRHVFYSEWSGMGGMEFLLNWKTGSSRVKNIIWRPGYMKVENIPGVAPERAIHAGGYTYLTNSYTSDQRWNQDRGVGIWRLGKDGVAKPIVLISDASDLNSPQWGWRMKNMESINKLWAGHDPHHVFFIWCDRNNDHIAQPNEIQYLVTTRIDTHGKVLDDIGLMPIVNPDLSVTTSWGTWIAPPKIEANGELQYNIRDQKIIGYPMQRSPVIGGKWTIESDDSIPAMFGSDIHGGKRWEYLYSPVQKTKPGPGVIEDPNRLIGPPVKPLKGDAGYVECLNGDKGEMYLITMDGMFLQTLGGDERFIPSLRMPTAKRGMTIDHVSFVGEQFHPTMTQSLNGTIYMEVGKESCSIVQLKGLSSVQRMDLGTVHLRKSPPEIAANTTPLTVRKNLDIPIVASPPKLSANLTDWPRNAPWATIDANASVSVVLTKDALYAFYKLGGANDIMNACTDYHYLFKTGGALDMMIGTDPNAPKDRIAPTVGDMRLLVALVKGMPCAVLYKPVIANGSNGNDYLFGSPIGTVHFDSVRNVSAEVKLAQSSGNFEFVVPLSLLNITPQSGQMLLGDLGVLRGDGSETKQRIYWSNPDTAMVNDVPTEARLTPGKWGVWNIK